MKVNYMLDKDNVIIGYTIYPFDVTLPFLEVKNPETDIIVGYSQLVNGKIKLNKSKYNEDMLLLKLRSQREIECFNIVNRGEVWYNTLSQEQKEELQTWYQAWLNVTDTKRIPAKPSWL